MAKTLVATGALVMALVCSVYGHAQQKGTPTLYRLSLPDKKWAMDVTMLTFDLSSRPRSKADLPANAFVTPVDLLTDKGEFQLLAFQTRLERTPLSSYLTIRLRPALSKLEPEDFRSFALKEIAKRDTVKSSSIKIWEHNEIPIARYTMLREYNDGNPPSTRWPALEDGLRNLTAYFVRDDVWATLTLTAGTFDADEEKLFYSLVDSIRFVDTSFPVTSFDYYNKGRGLYLHKDYRRAIEALSAALSLEQRQIRLKPAALFDLILDLADAYGATGNGAAAKEVLQYGISLDSANTTFHMLLARLYASDGDIDKSLVALERAFFYMKQDKTPGMSLPDLKSDPAFKELMKIARFRDAVKAMKK